jgi:hypothetical protein
MNFYAYKDQYLLGHEPLGTANRMIWRDLKTVRGAINRAKKLWGRWYRIYTFTNFYDDKTFKLVAY